MSKVKLDTAKPKWQVAKVSLNTGRTLKRMGEPTSDRRTAEIWLEGWRNDPRFQSSKWTFRIISA